jgi:hypothetical protein
MDKTNIKPAKRLTEKRTTFCYFSSIFPAGKLKRGIIITLAAIFLLSFLVVRMDGLM